MLIKKLKKKNINILNITYAGIDTRKEFRSFSNFSRNIGNIWSQFKSLIKKIRGIPKSIDLFLWKHVHPLSHGKKITIIIVIFTFCDIFIIDPIDYSYWGWESMYFFEWGYEPFYQSEVYSVGKGEFYFMHAYETGNPSLGLYQRHVQFVAIWPMSQWAYSLISLLGTYYFVGYWINRKKLVPIGGSIGFVTLSIMIFSDLFLNYLIGIYYMSYRETLMGKFMVLCPIAISPIIIVIEFLLFYWIYKIWGINWENQRLKEKQLRFQKFQKEQDRKILNKIIDICDDNINLMKYAIETSLMSTESKKRLRDPKILFEELENRLRQVKLDRFHIAFDGSTDRWSGEEPPITQYDHPNPEYRYTTEYNYKYHSLTKVRLITLLVTKPHKLDNLSVGHIDKIDLNKYKIGYKKYLIERGIDLSLIKAYSELNIENLLKADKKYFLKKTLEKLIKIQKEIDYILDNLRREKKFLCAALLAYTSVLSKISKSDTKSDQIKIWKEKHDLLRGYTNMIVKLMHTFNCLKKGVKKAKKTRKVKEVKEVKEVKIRKVKFF